MNKFLACILLSFLMNNIVESYKENRVEREKYTRINARQFEQRITYSDGQVEISTPVIKWECWDNTRSVHDIIFEDGSELNFQRAWHLYKGQDYETPVKCYQFKNYPPCPGSQRIKSLYPEDSYYTRQRKKFAKLYRSYIPKKPDYRAVDQVREPEFHAKLQGLSLDRNVATREHYIDPQASHVVGNRFIIDADNNLVHYYHDTVREKKRIKHKFYCPIRKAYHFIFTDDSQEINNYKILDLNTERPDSHNISGYDVCNCGFCVAENNKIRNVAQRYMKNMQTAYAILSQRDAYPRHYIPSAPVQASAPIETIKPATIVYPKIVAPSAIVRSTQKPTCASRSQTLSWIPQLFSQRQAYKPVATRDKDEFCINPLMECLLDVILDENDEL